MSATTDAENPAARGKLAALDALSGSSRRAIEARFWAKVNKTPSCWLWTGSVCGSGSVRHGQFHIGRVEGVVLNVMAHRYAWELARGPIPKGLQANHHCDVPRCVRPDHLFLGTQDDNLKDAARKKRFHVTRTTSSFCLADRLAIYAAKNYYGIGVALAAHYGVTKACISLIRSGRFVGAPNRRPA